MRSGRRRAPRPSTTKEKSFSFNLIWGVQGVSSIEPDDGGCQMDCGEEISSGFVVACRDGAEFLEVAEEILNEMTRLESRFVIGTLVSAIAPGWDHGSFSAARSGSITRSSASNALSANRSAVAFLERLGPGLQVSAGGVGEHGPFLFRLGSTPRLATRPTKSAAATEWERTTPTHIVPKNPYFTRLTLMLRGR